MTPDKRRIRELERIVREKQIMIEEIAAAARFGRGDEYSAKSIIAALKARRDDEPGQAQELLG